MADRSSSIDEKSRLVGKFVEALKLHDHARYNALILRSPVDSFDANMQALESLNSRLASLKSMDLESLSYQMAIKQITKQEQGQAQDMLKVFYGCYIMAKSVLIWNWVGTVMAFVSLVIGCLGLIVSVHNFPERTSVTSQRRFR